ncbi:hypothetical protein PN836_004180 [Ningiella sp. W23]|uniref:hypothetical protein n=1 Tax=Ningiella sp. W23 TaxID=3023715 RepID=UPI003756F1F3
MMNPFRRLDNALRPSGRKLLDDQNQLVGIYEILTFLLVVPSIIVFQLGFVFVASNIWIPSQIAQNRFVLSGLSIMFLNILGLPLAYFQWLGLNADVSVTSVAALSILLILTVSGFTALYAQKRQFSGERP